MQTTAKFTSHIVLAALGLIVYHQAQAAARIEPAGSAFTAQGPISFSKGALISADCTINMRPAIWPELPASVRDA